MHDVEYFLEMHKNDSARQLLDAYEEEIGILRDITEDDYYEDQSRQIHVQKDHIEAIKMLIDQKT